MPFGSVVQTDISYTYDVLKMNISSFSTIFPFISVGSIGKSVMGKDIPYLRIGTGKKEVFYSAAIHANEWITSPVIMKFIENLALSYVNDGYIYGYLARNLLNSVSIYIVPMVNPDGVDLVTNNISKSSNYYINAKKISENYPNIAFPSGWKANISGIGLINFHHFILKINVAILHYYSNNHCLPAILFLIQQIHQYYHILYLVEQN